MNPLSITTYPNAILKKKAAEVANLPPNITEFIANMIETMNKNDGVGLAAPQVGVSQQIIVVQDGKKAHGFLNPKILKLGKTKITDEEGCLSLPGIFLKIKRAEEIVLAAKTPEGKVVKIVAQGLMARIFQHEIDHLEGKLIINRVSPWQRFRIRKKLKRFSASPSSSSR